MIFAVILIILLLAALLYLIFPSKPKKGAEIFAGHPFAHRGLYDNDAGIPENSIPAFKRAVEHGFGCELDVQLTKDEKLVVFHDDDLKRMCGDPRMLREVTFEELETMRLIGTDEKIPTFDEVLKTVGGKIPLIVELKSERPDWDLNKRNCELTHKALCGYRGKYCIESFDPTIVRWFKENAPEIIRGQLATGMNGYGKMKRWQAFVLSRLFMNSFGRPNFIAYDIEYPEPLNLKLCLLLGAFRASWTYRKKSEHADRIKNREAVIFEHYIP